MDELEFGGRKIRRIPRNIQPNVRYGGVYLSWLQVGLGHHTMKPNTWSVNLRCLATSWCFLFRKTLSARPVHMDNNAMTHRTSAVTDYFQSEPVTSPQFESDRTFWGHARPSCTGSWTSCTQITSIGSSIPSGMSAATTAAYPTTDWRDETEG